MMEDFFIEVNCQQRNHDGQRICGDVYLSQRIPEENRIVAVLSDGMGHGVKANVLGTLTATIAMNFTKEHQEVEKTAEAIVKSLPVCSERKMSYSTFTVIDIRAGQEVRILEYGNPAAMIFRNGIVFDPVWNCIILKHEKTKGKEIRTCAFSPKKEDRIVVLTDGIVQSGLGSPKYPTGWGEVNASAQVVYLLKRDPEMSARKLAARMVNMALQNDDFHPKDDTSCMAIYFREPRKLMICSGPPFDESKDAYMAQTLNSFPGKRVICGATTAEILSRELKREITDHPERTDPDLPPTSSMEGVDLISEGLLTLSKVSGLLEKYNESYRFTKGPADQILKLILQSDDIRMLVGTRINAAHQDPSFPAELEIRRTLVRRIAKILERKFLKKVDIEYL